MRHSTSQLPAWVASRRSCLRVALGVPYDAVERTAGQPDAEDLKPRLRFSSTRSIKWATGSQNTKLNTIMITPSSSGPARNSRTAIETATNVGFANNATGCSSKLRVASMDSAQPVGNNVNKRSRERLMTKTKLWNADFCQRCNFYVPIHYRPHKPSVYVSTKWWVLVIFARNSSARISTTNFP